MKITLTLIIIALFMAAMGLVVETRQLRERLRITQSILNCYEQPNAKPVRAHLRKNGEIK